MTDKCVHCGKALENVFAIYMYNKKLYCSKECKDIVRFEEIAKDASEV